MNWIICFTALLGGLFAAASEPNGALGNNNVILKEQRATSETRLLRYYPDVICPAGQYRTKDETCLDCPLSSWSAEGATKCRDCDEGQYDVDHLYCSDCPPGTFSFKNCKDEKKNKCRPCGKGKVSPKRASVCTACTPGTYADHNINKCMPCPVGFYSRALADVCLACPLEMYSEFGVGKCRKCAKGYKPNSDRSGCQLIIPGEAPTSSPPTKLPTSPSTFVPTFTPTSTPTARPTISCPGGKFYDLNSGMCADCAAGFYSTPTTHKCINCPHKTYSGAGASVCNECPPGTKVNASQTKCV